MIVYISIGNSDDELSQQEWSAFVAEVEARLPFGGLVRRHGRWRSPSDDPWQNACWCVEIQDGAAPSSLLHCKEALAEVAAKYRQDSIAWAEVKTTEFLGASS